MAEIVELAQQLGRPNYPLEAVLTRINRLGGVLIPGSEWHRRALRIDS